VAGSVRQAGVVLYGAALYTVGESSMFSVHEIFDMPHVQWVLLAALISSLIYILYAVPYILIESSMCFTIPGIRPGSVFSAFPAIIRALLAAS
jgi:hypothetical protein